MPPELTLKQNDAFRRLGELLDDLDAEIKLLPDEPRLRSVVAEHAKEQLRKPQADHAS